MIDEVNQLNPANVTMTDAQKLACAASFAELCFPEIPKFQNRISYLVNPILNPKSIIEFSQVTLNSLAIGFNSIYNDKACKLSETYRDLTYFFLYYFLNAYEQSNQISKKILLGRLKHGFDIDMGFNALFLELAVAHTFRSKGHEVEFIEPSEIKGERRPDLLVNPGKNQLSIECKCVSAYSKFPVPTGLIPEVGSIFMELLKKHSHGKFEFLLTVRYLGSNSEPIANSVKNAQHLVENFNINYQNTSNLWEVILGKIPEEVDENYSETMYVPNSKNFPELEGAGLVSVSNAGFVVFKSSNAWKLDVAAEKAINEALSQLPETGLRLVCIQAVGSSNFSHALSRHNTSLTEILTGTAKTKRRVTAQLIKNDGFLGVQTIGDFVVYDREPGLSFINYFSGLFGGNYESLATLYMGFYKVPRNEFQKLYLKSISKIFLSQIHFNLYILPFHLRWV